MEEVCACIRSRHPVEGGLCSNSRQRRSVQLHAVEVRVPTTTSLETISVDSLPQDWPEDMEATRAIGSEWLRSMPSALLRVPSVLAPATVNVLLNPAHLGAKQIVITTVLGYPFDPRLKRWVELLSPSLVPRPIDPLNSSATVMQKHVPNRNRRTTGRHRHRVRGNPKVERSTNRWILRFSSPLLAGSR